MNAPVRFTRAGAWRGARASAGLLIATVPFGMVTGIAAQGAGLSLAEATAMSATVFAGAAQIVAMSHWTHPAGFLAALFTTLAINSRLLLLGPVLAPWLGRLRRWQRLVSLGLMADQNWAMSVREMNTGGDDAGFLLGTGLALWLVWLLTTIMGFLAGGLLHPPADHPLFFSALATFIALLAQMWRGGRDVLPWLVAAAVAVVTARLLPGGGWHIIAGAVAGSLTGAARDSRRGTLP